MAGSATLTPSKNGVQKAPEKKSTPAAKPVAKTLQEKIEHFEKLKGFTNKHERLTETLNDLNKFVYSQTDSVSFTLVDGSGKDFKTSNTELVKILVTTLQKTMSEKKQMIEIEIMEFEF